jgi:hypothetical protein
VTCIIIYAFYLLTDTISGVIRVPTDHQLKCARVRVRTEFCYPVSAMGTLGCLTSFSCQAKASVWLCKCKEKGQGFETGERLVEVSGRIGGLQWLKRRQNVCSLRASQSRGPLWRGRVLNNDTMQAVQAMKRAKGDPDKIDRIIETRVSRLVKVDILAVLKELQRQNECHLALRVFLFSL